jgi:hypothetical protein
VTTLPIGTLETKASPTHMYEKTLTINTPKVELYVTFGQTKTIIAKIECHGHYLFNSGHTKTNMKRTNEVITLTNMTRMSGAIYLVRECYKV